MTTKRLHDWDVTPKQAIHLQKQFAGDVVHEDRFDSLRWVAGVDVAYGRRGGPARAGVVLFDLAELRVVERTSAVLPATFPYVPGLLTFREAPAAIAALDRLQQRPELLLCDGQGVAHPRRIGFASHLGLFLDLPAIGVGKSRLVGQHDEPGPSCGDWTPLRDKGEIIGAVLRSRPGCKPIYVSIGHRVSLATAVDIVLKCLRGYRLPEPIRAADRLSKGTGSI
ncbi:MAG: deoxyribonuclease V [Hyphomicrobiales bacterium]|nr:deoxyribonuclease V [Hyphomicrobiales bacterium]